MSELRCVRAPDGSTPRGGRWGVDSEHGELRDVLVGDPAHYRWLGEENARLSGVARETLRRGHRFDEAAAQRQHAELVALFADAGVTVHTVRGDEHVPYIVYTRDSSVMTPFGAIVCQLANPRRRGEYAFVLRFLLDAGVPIYDMVTAGNFEGGDFHVVAPDKVVIGVSGTRTEEVAARQVAGWLEREGIEVRLSFLDDFFVHLDVMFCMVAPGLAAVCRDTIDPGLLDWIRAQGHDTVPVDYPEMIGLAGNVVALGRDRVLSSARAQKLNRRLEALGLEVLSPELAMYQLAGGGPHCLCQPLRRQYMLRA